MACPGDFTIAVGASSRDLRLTETVTVDAPSLALPVTRDSAIWEWLAHPVGGPLLLQTLGETAGSSITSDPTLLAMIESLPLSRLVAMSGDRIDTTELDRLADELAEQRKG